MLQQYTFNIPDNVQAKQLLDYILRTNIFELNEKKEPDSVSSTDFWGELPFEVKQDIELAQEQMKQGKVKPHDKILEKYKSWIIK